MITRAVLRYVRITPRKFRQIIPLVKGKNPEEAIAILTSVKKGASKYGIDVISSAINNTKRMQGVEVADLYISNLVANGGPMLKRFRAASMGRASLIKKRTSHITVELDRVARPAAQAPKAAAAKYPHKEAAAAVKKEAVKSKHPEIKKKSTTKKGKE
ncbi:MAG: 50S ribosomal protein L22 [Candidatus Omnitrophica bacterium]|nr:50S ribosomal protein L22 [Candidatus Omnitrophota bacterium]